MTNHLQHLILVYSVVVISSGITTYALLHLFWYTFKKIHYILTTTKEQRLIDWVNNQ